MLTQLLWIVLDIIVTLIFALIVILIIEPEFVEALCYCPSSPLSASEDKQHNAAESSTSDENQQLGESSTSPDENQQLGESSTYSDQNQQLGESSIFSDQNQQLGESSTSPDKNQQLGESSISSDQNQQLGESSISSDQNQQLGESSTSSDQNQQLGESSTSSDQNQQLGESSTSSDQNQQLGESSTSSDQNQQLGESSTSSDRNQQLGESSTSSDRNQQLGEYSISSDQHQRLGESSTTSDQNKQLGESSTSSDQNQQLGESSIFSNHNQQLGESSISSDQNQQLGESSTSSDQNQQLGESSTYFDQNQQLPKSWTSASVEKLQLGASPDPNQQLESLFGSNESYLSGEEAEIECFGGEECSEIPVEDERTREKMPVQETDHISRYKMEGKEKAMCIIINNEEFPESEELSRRHRSYIDSEKLVKCYEKQGFDVRLCENLIKLEMDQVMKEIAVMDHSQKDCLVCNILSHGDADNVYGSDGMKFPIQELLKIFKADSCPSLENKPKMFFIQACRKDTSSIQETCRMNDNGPQATVLPEDHIFVSFSTLLGEVAYREFFSGSLYITTLVDIIDRHADSLDIEKMVTMVEAEVIKDTADEIFNGVSRRQSPQHYSTLRYEFYFK